MSLTKHVTAVLAAISVAAGIWVAAGLPTRGAKAQQAAPPSPVGAWFGIARPCTSGSRFEPPSGTVNQSICREACFGAACPMSKFPVDEVTMIPTILADGTVLADDFAELLDHHSTAQGKWEFAGTTVIDGRRLERYQASFIWFQPRSPQDIDPKNPLSIFQGVVRPRFVTFFDAAQPDVMSGFIQPYLYAMTDRFGIVDLVPGTPFPRVDPIARLPVNCDPSQPSNPFCLGTLNFVIRRIQAH